MQASAHTIRIAVFSLLALGLAPGVLADYRETFREGVRAVEFKKWEEAAELMQKALAENSSASGEGVLISGTFRKPYIPYFYLGLALFKSNPGSFENCEAALQNWEISVSQGVIQNVKKEYRLLRALRQECTELLLPRTVEEARGELRRASELHRHVAEQLEHPLLAHDAELQSAYATLREAFEASKTLDDAQTSSRLDEVREVGERTGALRTQLEELARRARSEIAARLFAEAVAAAQEAVSTAQGIERALADLLEDPDRAAVWQSSPALTMPKEAKERLEAARQKLDLGRGTSNLAMAEEAQREAHAAETIFEEVRTRAEQRLADFVDREVRLIGDEIDGAAKLAEEVYELRQDPELSSRWPELFGGREKEAEDLLSTARRHLDSGRDEASLSDLVAARRSAQQASSRFDDLLRAIVESRERPEVTEPTATQIQPSESPPEVQRLVRVAEQVLDLIGNEPTGSHLLESQRSKLGTLIQEARQQGQLKVSYERLLSSVTALQVLAAAEAYLGKEYQRTVDILAAQEISSGAFASQALLFRAAALFSLYAIGGEARDSLRDEAATAVRRCRFLDPELEPAARLFSPSFREFFDRN